MDHGYAEHLRWAGLLVAGCALQLTANSIIGTTELIEANRKGQDEIYLSTIGKDVDTFTVAQADELFAIANQCPEVSLPLFLESSKEDLVARRGMQTERSHSYVRLCITKYGRKRPLRSPKDNGRETSTVGGNAVYAARALYRQVNDTLAWDDQLLCLPHGILVKSMHQGQTMGMSLHPNPARDEITLVLGQGLDGPGQFMVYNALGAVVLRAPLEAEVVRHTLGTGSLAPALYHYQVRGPSGLVGTGKLTIIR